MQDLFAKRRRKFLEALGDAVALIPTAPSVRRNADTEYRYRPDSDFYYLTGCEEPEALAVFAPGSPHPYLLFVRPRDPEREQWTGYRLGVEGAIEKLGADAAMETEEIEKRLPGLIENRETLYFSWDCNPDFERMLLRTIYRMRRQKRRGTFPPTRLVDAGTILHEMRLRKGEEEVALLRRAAEVTAAGHLAAMRSVRPGMFEYEVEALLEHAFRSRGAIGPGYPSIVGGGANAVILHYIENRSPLRAGDLLLIDAGAEVEHYYTADVTRTFPISGRFSEPQRQLYEIVLAAQKNAIAAVRPGATMGDVHHRAVETITHALLELGWLEGNLETSIEEEAYRPFYMHKTSHWLGMDVHDAGDYFRGGRERPFEAGMVLTVEPGLYVAPGSKGVDPRYHGIGIRIEDDVLVTPQGHEVLTSMIPKEIAEIESVMQRPAGEEAPHSFPVTP